MTAATMERYIRLYPEIGQALERIRARPAEGSRQSKTDKYTIQQVITALQMCAGIKSMAAQKLGCKFDTVTNYIDRYPEVAQALTEIEEDKLDLAEAKILTHIRDGNLGACIFYVKCKGKRRGWTERTEVTGRDGKPLFDYASAVPAIRDDITRKFNSIRDAARAVAVH